MLAVAVLLNNYFHDLATALLAVSAVMLLVLGRGALESGEPAVQRFFAGRYHKLRWLLRGSLGWILTGGAIRLWAYRDYEWSDAAGRGQIAALGVKHAVLGAAVLVGLVAWIRLERKLRAMPAIREESTERQRNDSSAV